MKVEVIAGKELSNDLVRRWAELQEGHVELTSPYFRPEFTQLVSAVRRDVRVAVIHEGSKVMGFLPFHRRFGGMGRPVGLGLSDYHGIIADPHADWPAADLLRGCGLVGFKFDHLPVSQHLLMSGAKAMFGSPVIEPCETLELYEARLERSGRKQVREAIRKQRKLDEQTGNLTITVDHHDESALAKVIQWKSEQCRRTGTFDYFAIPWCRELVEQIHGHQTSEFGGLLATMYVGGELVAAHFAMRSSNVWHSWFPAYDAAYHEYSPGSGLLVEMIRAAGAKGVRCIDLGKGKSLYKRQLMTSEVAIAEGVAEIPSVIGCAKRMCCKVRQMGQRPMLRPIFHLPIRVVDRLAKRWRFV